MGLKVIGAGFGRTGTLSLKLALEQLGFGPSYHMFELFNHHPDHIHQWDAAHQGKPVDWELLYSNDYSASVDWPSCNHWKELSEYYPDAKIIINARDPESWHESVLKTIYPSSIRSRESSDPRLKELGEWLFRVIWDGVFNGQITDRSYAISIYNQHVENVLKSVPSDRLLVFEGTQSWEPLCEFLDCSIPDQPFPRANSTEEFNLRKSKKS